jgi:hypothetical protein
LGDAASADPKAPPKGASIGFRFSVAAVRQIVHDEGDRDHRRDRRHARRRVRRRLESFGTDDVRHLADWLEQEGECEEFEAEVTRLPVSKSHAEEVAPINRRFDHASVAAIAGCGGLNGYISYYRFPSSKARADAIRGREGLISNELFCVRGPELIVNGLLGYDQTGPFCKRLGFKIHQPTGRYSSAQKREHHLELRAASFVSHVTEAPTVNVECWHTEGLLRFECEEVAGGTITEVVRKGGRYVIESCKSLRTHRTKNGFQGKTCALPSHPR